MVCKQCRGVKRVVVKTERLTPFSVRETKADCPRCRGTGQEPPAETLPARPAK